MTHHDIAIPEFTSEWKVRTVVYPLRLSRMMGDAINSLGAEIIWVTSWQDHAHLVGDIVGIEAPAIMLPGVNKTPGVKRDAVEAYVRADPRPFIWFEDDPGAHGMARLKPWPEGTPPMFLINPAPRRGLLRDHVEDARAWIKLRT